MAWFQKAPTPPAAAPELHCSFCGESQRRVAKLIAGPKVYICDRCVRLCDDILDEKAPPLTGAPAPDLAGTFEDLPGVEDEAREDLAGRGLLRELLARVDAVVVLPALTEAEMGAVLTRPDDGLLPVRCAALAAAGCPVELGDGVVGVIQERAAGARDGAWALHRTLARLAEEALARGGPCRIEAEVARSW